MDRWLDLSDEAVRYCRSCRHSSPFMRGVFKYHHCKLYKPKGRVGGVC